MVIASGAPVNVTFIVIKRKMVTNAPGTLLKNT
jgi:hypothetical protein